MDVEISTTNSKYYPGDVVEGTVSVTREKASESADSLDLQLFGRSVTRVGDKHFRTEPQKRKFLSYDLDIGSFAGKANVGTHIFPFSVKLPEDLVPSMEEEDSIFNCCCISYGFKARVRRPGILNFNRKSSKLIDVLVKPQEPKVGAPVMVGPSTKVVETLKSGFGKARENGSMTIGFLVGGTKACLTEPLKIILAARNDSKVAVDAMYIEIVQETRWYSRRVNSRKKRTVVSIEVPGSELNELQPIEERKGTTVIGDTARRSLEELLAAGAGTSYDLFIPNGYYITLETSLIKVRYSLNVRLETPKLFSSPTVSMPLLVRPASGVVRGQRLPSMGSSLVEVAPLSADTEAYIGEYPKPTEVPQSEVRIKHNIENTQRGLRKFLNWK